MKPGEIIRIIAFSLVGALLMFSGQVELYRRRIIGLRDVRVETWLSSSYTPGAILVFSVSVVSLLLWYILAARAKAKVSDQVFGWQVIWWVLLLFPVLSVCGALFFFNRSNEALVSLTLLFVLDAVFFLYWLPSVTSTPATLKYAVPGAFFVRRFLGLN